MNVTDPFLAWLARTPRAAAIVEAGGTTSYRDLGDMVERLAGWFRSAGWGRGTTIGVSLAGPAAIQIAVMLALARGGALQLPLGAREPPRSHDSAIRRFAVQAIVADHRSVPSGIPIAHLETILRTTAPMARRESTDPPDGAAPWTIVLSSGTTGAAKAVRISHAMELARSAQQPDFIRPGPGDRVLCLLPIDTRGGRSVALRCLSQGASFLAPSGGADASEAIRLLAQADATFLIATPSQLAGLAAMRPEGAGVFGRLKVLRTNSGRMPPALLERIRTAITGNVFVDYGTNDAGTLSIATPSDLARHPDTVGRPVADLTLEIVDGAGRVLGPSGRGEIRVRGPGVADGYIDDPQATDRAFRDGWFYPGDIGERDAEGLLYVRGRVDALINFGGTKVSPQEIEAAALTHPAVAEAAAFAVPSSRFEGIPAVAVVLNRSVSARSIRAHCEDRLGSRAPRHVLVVDALPRDALGKISTRRLLDLLE
ncbi:MAG: class I adenylate-forming enzyme family protein [Alphaproteobacteria bacterium]